jgi:hypothetical protein
MGGAEGDGIGDAFNDEGTATVPTSVGLIVGVTSGGGVGVGVVETSIGVDPGVPVKAGVGIGVSVGVGGCPNAASANRDAVKANPIKFLRMVGNESWMRANYRADSANRGLSFSTARE